jgi:hypothetical protein
LAAADEHVAATGRGGQGEQHRRGVVVDDQCVFGTGQSAEHVVHMLLPRSTLAGSEIELEIAVVGSGHDDRFERLGRQDGAAEVGVHDDAGGVDHAAQRGCDGGHEQRLDPRRQHRRREVAGSLLGLLLEDLAAKPVEHGANGINDERARIPLAERCDARLSQDFVHGS